MRFFLLGNHLCTILISLLVAKACGAAPVGNQGLEGPSTSSERPPFLRVLPHRLPEALFDERVTALRDASRTFLPPGLDIKAYLPSLLRIDSIAAPLQAQLGRDPDTLKYVGLGPASGLSGGVALAVPMRRNGHLDRLVAIYGGQRSTHKMAIISALPSARVEEPPTFYLHGLASVNKHKPLFETLERSGNDGGVFNLRQILERLRA